MGEKLVGSHRRALLGTLSGWTEVADRDAIRKVFHFADFAEAWGFLTRIALMAEKMGHHPRLYNLHNHVEVSLTTENAGGVTARDVDMARFIDGIAPVHATRERL